MKYCWTVGRSAFPEGNRVVGVFNFDNYPDYPEFAGDEQSFVAYATNSYQHFERWMTPLEVQKYKGGHYRSVHLGRNVPADLISQ